MQDCVKKVRDLESSYEDINALIELTEEEEDREMIKEIQREIAKFEKEFEDLFCRFLNSHSTSGCEQSLCLDNLYEHLRHCFFLYHIVLCIILCYSSVSDKH